MSKNEYVQYETPNNCARKNVSHPYLAMTALYMGTFTGMLSETSLNIALPALQKTFQVSSGTVQWLVVGYMLVIGLVLPFAGSLMKSFSVRSLTATALAVFLAGSLISGLAPDFPILLTGRMIQGIGTGLLLPMTFAVALEIFPSHQLGAAMGVTALVIMFAPAIGPTLSGLIINMISWRGIFFCFAAILAAALLFSIRFTVSPYTLTHKKIDIVSCILSVIGFGCVVTGAGLASDMGWTSIPVLILSIAGIAAIILYVRRQFFIAAPVLNFRAMKITQFRVGALLVMINFGITLSSMYLLPQFFQNGLLLPVALTGIAMLPGGILNAVVSFVSGRMYDHLGAKKPVICGFSLSIIGALLLLTAGSDSSVVYVIAAHLILMTGIPLAMSPAQTRGLYALPPELSADGSTILNTMQQVIGAICTAITTSLLSAGQHFDVIKKGTDAVSITGFHFGFAFTLILAVCGFILSFKIKDIHK